MPNTLYTTPAKRSLGLAILLLTLALITTVSVAPLAAELPPEAAAQMLKEIKYLASDELEGRGVGTRGLNLAAEAVRDGFAAAGLDVTAVDGGAFQEFEVVAGSELESPNELTLISPQRERLPFEYDQQFRTCSFGAAGKFNAPLVFCGYGVIAEDVGYNDFAGIDVKGKIAVILRRTPQQDQKDGLFSDPHAGTSRHAALNTKLKHAIDHGAVAVLFVNDAHSGQSELAQLKEQRESAEKNVIEVAVALVSGEPAMAHGHGHNPQGNPHAEGNPHGQNPHANPHAAPRQEKEKASSQAADETAEQQSKPDAKSTPASDQETERTPSEHGNPHAPADSAKNPHEQSPHGHGHSAHGHGSTPPGIELRSAVTHLQEVRQLIEEYNADPLMEFGYNGNRRGESIPVMQVKREAIDGTIQAALGKSLIELESEIDETGKPHSRPLDGWTAAGQTSLRIKRVPVKNMIGVLPGKGPHSDETIVIGAHYDHLGRGGEGSLMPGSTDIHNGADDNASGTVALIELARRLAAREEPLPRRLVFIAFTGEERGLLGSAHYVKNPLFPNEKTIAMFNMDMVGRLTDDELTVFGSGTATRWEDLLNVGAETYGFDLTKKPEGFGPSDHSSFYAKQIPVLHFFTGTHNDYHRPTDDWQAINVKGMGRVVELLEDLIVATAETERRPTYVAVKGQADLQARSGSRPYFGSIPDFSGEASGYAIQGVSPGSPADKAGLKGGDVIIKLGEFPITSLNDFDLALREFSPGEEVTVVVRRAGKEEQFRLTLATPR